MLKRDPNQPIDTSKGYEESDVRVSMLAWGIGITFIVTFASFVAMRLFVQALSYTPSVSTVSEPTTAAYRFEQLPPPGPGLQVDLAAELAALVAPQRYMLNHYGWISEPEGMVHIPIDAAIERAVRDGLPEWTGPAVPAPEVVDAAAETVEDAGAAQPEEAADAPLGQ